MPKRATGLTKRWSRDRQTYWWEIDKRVGGERLRVSTGTSDYAEAERRLAYEVEQARQRQVYGVSEARTFAQAAARYLDENGHKRPRTIARDILALDFFMPYIGHLPLHQVHQGTLQPAIAARSARVCNGTVNRDMAAVRRPLTLSARLWRDENGRPWLNTVPLIQKLPEHGKRRPYPLTWDEQRLLFDHLPRDLERMALFDVNTGMRDQEICQMKWSWEERIDGHSVFVIPPEVAKNGEARLVVCNRVAQNVIDGQRGAHGTWVWPSSRPSRAGFIGPVGRMLNNGWRSARTKAAEKYSETIGGPCPRDYARIRVHDLRHTFGRRLRAADVSKEDRADLLGHRSGSITTDYSAAEIHNLIAAANKVCDGKSRPLLRVVG
ncbi:tyrosine-type recombinase/integrase [Salinisphaera sp. T31B1]|uniref:tyrosine-type recombinase/integrase n=1 Tax=Salinisphaera sp. T31B1 TaxID=727963 RepID=UPI00334137FA